MKTLGLSADPVMSSIHVGLLIDAESLEIYSTTLWQFNVMHDLFYFPSKPQ